MLEDEQGEARALQHCESREHEIAAYTVCSVYANGAAAAS